MIYVYKKEKEFKQAEKHFKTKNYITSRVSILNSVNDFILFVAKKRT